MNQNPSQFRLVLSWSHVVASRICGLAVRGCSAMSAMTKSLESSDAVFIHGRGRRSGHVVDRAGCNQLVARPIARSAIDALQLPLAVRDRTLGVLGARAVVGEHVDHQEVGDRGCRLLAWRA